MTKPSKAKSGGPNPDYEGAKRAAQAINDGYWSPTIQKITKYPEMLPASSFKGRLLGTYRCKEYDTERKVLILEHDPNFSPQRLELPREMVPEGWVKELLCTSDTDPSQGYVITQAMSPDYVCYLSRNYDGTKYFYSTES